MTLVFALIALVAVPIVFLVVGRLRGLGLGLAAGALTFVGMLALYLAIVVFVTSQML